MIYGGVDAEGIVFDGVAEALAFPDSEVRLFGKPVSFVRRRMGVALARAENTDLARDKAAKIAATVKPHPA